MWALIFPVCSLPLLLTLLYCARKAKKSGTLEDYKSPFQQLGFVGLVKALFWQLDVIGIILMIAVFGLILTPFTLAGGVSRTWGTAHIIAPLVVGIVLVPIFVLWERKAKHALIPFHLLKDRGVWSALCIGLMVDTIWYCQGMWRIACDVCRCKHSRFMQVITCTQCWWCRSTSPSSVLLASAPCTASPQY